MITADASAASIGIAPSVLPRTEHALLAQLIDLLGRMAASPFARKLAWLGLGVSVVVAANTFGQIRLNDWNGAFYDALEQRQIGEFLRQTGIYVIICTCLLCLVVAQTWMQERLKVRLRQWVTHELLDQWLVPKRGYRLELAGEIGANPDQRMQEDARRLTELTAELGVGLLQASLLLMSFVGVLWVLSEQIVFAYDGAEFTIPGYMVWWAVAYSIGGSWLVSRVGRPLIPLNAERYGLEAEFRSALVRVNEHAEGVALHGGERDERVILDLAFGRVVELMVALANGVARVTWVTSGFGWLAMIVPIVAAAPGYFGGSLSFGGLMMVAGGFLQVQQALRWYVDNFSRIADWRATLSRVVTFREALQSLDSLAGDTQRIEVQDHPDGYLLVEDLQIALPQGRVSLSEGRLELRPGERVRIVGAARSGKSTLFRALAGLWDVGTGKVMLPPRDQTSFLSERPYLPLGSLRTVLTYPAAATGWDDAALGQALRRVGLGHLVASLDQEQRWDHVLSLGEQQRLAFARMLLHRPRWIFLDAPMSAVDLQDRGPLWRLLDNELAEAAVVLVTRHEAEDGFAARTLQLSCTPNGWRHPWIKASEPRGKDGDRRPTTNSGG